MLLANMSAAKLVAGAFPDRFAWAGPRAAVGARCRGPLQGPDIPSWPFAMLGGWYPVLCSASARPLLALGCSYRRQNTASPHWPSGAHTKHRTPNRPPPLPPLPSPPRRALLRCHPPPNMHKLQELAAVAKDLGFALDIDSAGALQARPGLAAEGI